MSSVRQVGGRQGRRRRGIFGFALGIALVLCVAPNTALGGFHANPTNGEGKLTYQGTDSTIGPYTAVLHTSFQPHHIVPGQPFKYYGFLTVDSDYADTGCPTSVNQDAQYNQLSLWRVGAGEDHVTEGSPDQAVISSSLYDSPERTRTFCPQGYHAEFGQEVVFVSGAQSKMLPKYGCYQSSVVDSGLYFPSGPTELQPPSSLRGTLATLRVDNGLGDVPDCAGAGAAPIRDQVRFTGDSASLPIDCGQLSSRCKGKAKVLAVRARKSGRHSSTKGGCKHCQKIAVGRYAVARHSRGSVKLKLTKAGINLFHRAPRCSKCKMKRRRASISAHLVLTSATGTKSKSPIQVRRNPRCGYGCKTPRDTGSRLRPNRLAQAH
jgi:hypothetical protein